ncbi:hypothetical protein SPI_00122 [Niveomyces insectorum RCEF 264]|uniref:Uncharacterized protein n=1 Tax=Niveomyces insectorum RCEF 264 TaxID=1081102 RepID=A0A167ZUN8_9HYPO|nr:hypothetical protein SPI_00122 [Niveomyces insectorum RCEF 264]
MLYEEYAQLGRGRPGNERRSGSSNNNNTTTRRSRSESRARYSMQQSNEPLARAAAGARRRSQSAERPYLPSHASFSVPRRSLPLLSHSVTVSSQSSSSDTSNTSLSPSNSASQIGSRRLSSKDRLLTIGGGRGRGRSLGGGAGGKLTASSLAQLKDLERNASAAKRRKGGITTMAGLIDVPLAWRPYYLQRKILIAFFAVFAASIIVSEALLDYSGRNAGLIGKTDPNLRYLYSLAPTAILTVIAGLWSRVDYQAKMSAPWLRLAKGPESADKTLLLDYFSMLPPRDAIRALKNGDMTVACASIIALILKLVIIVSTGMISLSVLDNTESTAPITLTTEFVNNATHLANVGSYPFLTMVGLERDNLTFPGGVSSRYAFQEFTSDISSATQFRATVDGFSSELECEAAQLALNGIRSTRFGVLFDTTISTASCAVTLPVVSQSFNGTGATNRTHFFARFGHAACGNSSDLAAQRVVVVYGTGSIDSRAVLSTGNNQAVNGTIPQSQQLLCTPTYTISQVDIVKNGSFIDSVTLDDTPEPRTLSNVQPWAIAQAFFASHTGAIAAHIADTSTPYFSAPLNVNVDAPMFLAFGLQAQVNDANSSITPPSSTSLLDASALQDFAGNYYRQYAALIARQALMQPASIATSCTAFIGGDLLIVGTVAVQIVAVLLAAILLLNVVAICVVPGKGFLPRDPHSLLDVAALLSHSRPLLQTLRGAGGADQATLRNRLSPMSYYTGVEAYDRGSAETGQGYFRVFTGYDQTETNPAPARPTGGWHHPFGLHPVQRVLMYVFLGGLIAGLEVALRVSSSRGGFTTIGIGGYMHFVWTMVPALVATAIAVFFMVTDFHVRALAPFAKLTQPEGGSIADMTFSLLDRTPFVAVYRSVRTRDVSVAGAAMAVLLATVLPVLTPTLFSAMTIPKASQVRLVTQDYFSNTTNTPANFSSCTNCADGMALASLILDGNLSYPAFTYQDLAFPTLSIIPLIGVNETDDLKVTATVPGVRSLMTCRLFAQPDIAVNLTTNYRIGGVANPLRIDLPGEPQPGTSELLSSTLVLGTAQSPFSFPTGPNQTATGAADAAASTIDQDAYFGLGAYRPLQAANGSSIAHWVYAWGQLNNANTNQTTVRSISAMACNESMQRVDSTVLFVGSVLTIRPDTPPQPIDSTAAPSDVALSPNLNYANLVHIATSDLLDPFFGSLVSSQYAVPVSDLGNGTATRSGAGTQNNSVAEAIVKQHGIIRAQIVNMYGRRPTTASSRPADVFPLDANGTVMGNATELSFTARLTSVSDGQRHLLQDAPTTRTLQALLGALLLCSVVSWVAFPGPGNVLPRPVTSIASVAALLADGNLFGFFGRGPEWQTADELQAAFRDGLHVTAGFMLGWARARRPPRQSRADSLAYGGVNGDTGTNTGSGSGRDEKDELFGINAARTGGWGGGENVGLGLQARVGYAQRAYVGNWGWRT